MGPTVDVVVAGGGPAGATAARRLALAGCTVVVADSPPAAGDVKVGEALPPAAKPLLTTIGVWERFLAQGHLVSYGNSASWGSPLLAGTDFIFDPNGQGWHLDRLRFDAFLRAEAAAGGAAVRRATVRHHTRSTTGEWQLTLEDGTVLRARWLVDATGRRSAIARRHGGRRRILDATVALVARLGASRDGSGARRDTDSRTFIEAVRDGWWYSALVPGDGQVVAYVTDRDLVWPSLRTPGGFVELLRGTRHLGPRLGGYEVTNSPRQVAAGSALTEPAAGDGWVAVGDAALAFDPLSAQGILTALYTGMVAADALRAELEGGEGAVRAYADQVDKIAASYRRNLARFYAIEQRWPDRPFWRRRPSVPGPSTGDSPSRRPLR